MNIPFHTSVASHFGLHTPGVRQMPPREVLLRSACVVEYAAKLADSADRGANAPIIDEDSGVVLTVYVRRSRLNPTRVRIVEV